MATPGENKEEFQYLDAVDMILAEGDWREGRNGRVISLPGLRTRWSLEDKVLPLLTSKRVFWKGVREELLWLVSGSTYAPDLASKGVHIWDANATREFLDGRGLTGNVEGDLGPIYGYQWRHWGHPYEGVFDEAGKRISYEGKGRDQLQQVIDTLKTNPSDRRMVVSGWNVGDLDSMALPPCHMFYQFHVGAKGLTCMMYQRSADWGLGVPFNIASYSLLTHMVASVVGIPAYQFIHIVGDAHIYEDHLEALKSQTLRKVHPFPTVEITKKASIDELGPEDIRLVGYSHSGPLKMVMSA
jgi:thymidylate synthase